MRYYSIDILRTMAIAVMVFVHFGENLAGFNSPFAGLGAPLFAFLSGVSYWLWVQGRETAGASEAETSRVSVRRGLFVFGFGFAFNVLVWLPEEIFNWDVLTMIGFALIVLNFARKTPLPVPAIASFFVVLIGPIVRQIAGYEAYWTELYFDHNWTLPDLFIGFTAVGYFPIFPWLAYALTGLTVGRYLFVESSEKETRLRLQRVFLTGCGLIFVGCSLLAVRSYLPTLIQTWLLGGWHMFPPTVEYVAVTLGNGLVLLSLLHQLIDRRKSKGTSTPQYLKVATTFSRYSLTIYVLHHIVHIWPMWMLATYQGQETTIYWKKAMSLELAWALAVLFLVASYVILRVLGPKRSYGVEAAMRWVCD